MMFRLAAYLALWSPLAMVDARSTGAPTCVGGESAPSDASAHKAGGDVAGTLASGGLVVTIDGSILTVGAPLELFTGEPHNVTISTTTTPFFRGVMARIDGGDAMVDSSMAFTVMEGDTKLQDNIFCDGIVNVGGITHRNADDVTEVMFQLTLDEASTNMAFDINIVETLSPSVFYYDQYLITAVDPPVPTSSPTSVPTMMPTEQKTIYEFAVDNNLTLAALVDAAGLAPVLDNPMANLTLMAPLEEKFAELPPRIVQYLLDNADTLLQYILLGHVLPFEAPASVVAGLDGEMVTFVNNVSQTISVMDGVVSLTVGGDMFDAMTTVVAPDAYYASNGIIHAIDRILGLPTIYEAVTASGSFLLTAINVAGIAPILDSLSDVTLMAPTNEGFLSLSDQYPGLATAVIAGPAWGVHLGALLSAHIFMPALAAEDVLMMDGQTLTAISGDNFTVSVNGTMVSLSPASTGAASVVVVDGLTTQGIIHAIDGTLIPFWLTQNIVDVALVETPVLASLIVAADLDDDLAEIVGLTVFAPTDDAFDKLDDDLKDFLTSPEGKDTLIATLSYHVLPIMAPADLVVTGSYDTLEGTPIQVSASATGVVINGESNVIETDILASNGIMHLIDTVLLIPPSAAPTTSPTAAPTPVPTPSMARPTTFGFVGATIAMAASVSTLF